MANARLGWFSPLGLAASIRVAVRRVGLRAHCFRFSACAASEIATRRVGLRAHCFRFSVRTASEIALGEFVLPPSVSEIAARWLAFGFTASAFRHAPFRSGRWAGWPSGSLLPLFGLRRFGDCPRRAASSAFRFGVAARRVGLRAHCFRFSACTDSEIALGGLAFGLTASAFRYAPLWRLPSAVGLRTHRFRFSARTASELPSAGWPSGSRLPLFGTYRFGDCRSAGWPSGSRLSLFGTHRSAPPYRRREGRRSTPTRHLFHFKTLISTC